MKRSVICLLGMVLVAIGCSEKTVAYNPLTVDQYFPLKAGSVFTYRLDSTVITAFGADTAVRRYRVKDSIAERFTDATGRSAWRILRSIQPVAGTAPFRNSESFVAVLEGDRQMEWMENNLRFLKLQSPVELGFSWKAHSLIETTTQPSPVRYLADWEYQYTDINVPVSILGKTYADCIIVLQRDQQLPEGPFDPRFFKQWDYGKEVYAKDIGLIYRNFDHKVWQPPTPGRGGYWTDESYRVILQLESFRL